MDKYEFINRANDGEKEMLIAKAIAFNRLFADRKISETTFLTYLQNAQYEARQLIEFGINKA